MERLQFSSENAKHIQAYIEYEQIVGNVDGGKMMSEAEFAAYKAQVREKRKNRLYVYWRNMETGADCKAIGPASQCFCGHRFKEHFFDNVETKKVFCRATGAKCKCKLFDYIPVFGSQDFKCMCKHSCHEHNVLTRKCTRPNCKCAGFTSKHSCSCGMAYDVHQTVFETRAEREAQGRQVDPQWMQESNMVAGMGGLTNDFSGLADEQDRIDMMNPAAIMGNLDEAGMITGPGFRAVEGGNPRAPGNRLAIEGQGQQQQQMAGGQLVPVQQQGPNALDLFNTPHSFGGGGGVSSVTKRMRALKM